MRNYLILGLLGLILISGCTSTASKYTANDFISAVSVNLDGARPQISDKAPDMKSVHWNVSGRETLITIYIDKDSATAIKDEQGVIDWAINSTNPTLNLKTYQKKTISGQELTSISVFNNTIKTYMWTKDNFVFQLSEPTGVQNSHIDELATRIISVYNK